MMFCKLFEALRSDIKAEVLKFSKTILTTFVSSAMDIEKALEQKKISVNNLNANSVPNTSNRECLITILLKQADSNKMQLNMAEQLKDIKKSGQYVISVANYLAYGAVGIFPQ